MSISGNVPPMAFREKGHLHPASGGALSLAQYRSHQLTHFLNQSAGQAQLEEIPGVNG
jgi:hypothetical protein